MVTSPVTDVKFSILGILTCVMEFYASAVQKADASRHNEGPVGALGVHSAVEFEGS